MNETETIIAIRAGDIEQYAELVERYQAGLVIHLDRMLSDRTEAEDITQQAFIRAYEKLNDFDEQRARFSTWLYKIASNLAIGYLRTSHRSVPTEMETVETLAPVYPSVEKDELAAETRAAVLKLVPPEHRLAIEAYYWHGQSYQAIADEMDVPINTVKSWLRRAKQQLREELA